MATASAFDAVLAGCCVLPIARELDAPWNNLDILEDEFPLCRAVPESGIRSRLDEIFRSRRAECDDEFARARLRLQRGIAPVSDDALSAFITEVVA
jgi:hypothetical protein